MKEKRKYMYFLIIGIIIGTVTVVLADTIAARLVTYDNTRSKSNVTTVQDAIDQLYSITVHNGTGITLTTSLPGGISSTMKAGLYRYQGLVDTANNIDVDNYICFGTTNVEECTETHPDIYLYRIIGIDGDGQMKLIKRTSLGTYAWGSSGQTWANSTLSVDLNGSLFLTHETDGVRDYVPSGWENRIADTDWHDLLGSNPGPAEGWANAELGATTVKTKIGLMYVHDFYYANPAETANKDSWIHLTKNGLTGTNEWTISRYTTNYAWHVSSNGSVGSNGVTRAYAVRPVFYLKSPEKMSSNTIASGSGIVNESIKDPYILSN